MSDATAPARARPVRELLPHLVWEAILLVAALGVTIGLYSDNSKVFDNGAAWASLAVAGFVATGLALSLRTATPNLAVGPLAALAGWIYADDASIVTALLAAAGVGLVMALLTGLTGLPGWAVTLVGGACVQAWLVSHNKGGVVPLPRDLSRLSYGPWVAAFVVASILGGVLFAVPAVRRLLAANRPAGGEAGAFSAARLLGALVGVGGSALIAGAAGILQVRYLMAATPYDTGLLAYGLPAVLLGGVSVFGRRAGIFGVVLAVVIVDFTRRWEFLHAAESSTTLLTAAGFAVLGLLVVWLIELIGRRASPLVGPAAAAAPGFPPPYPPPLYPAPAGAGLPGPPYAAQPYGTPPYAGPPVSGPPTMGPPTSGPPVSGPSVGPPVSGPSVGPPVSGPPVGPPVSGAPAPPSAARDDSWPENPPPNWPPAS